MQRGGRTGLPGFGHNWVFSAADGIPAAGKFNHPDGWSSHKSGATTSNVFDIEYNVCVTARFQWDEANRRHLAERLGISVEEVEEVMQHEPIEYRLGYRNGELRKAYVGPTAAGRMLFVVTTMRGDLMRIITAYPAPRKMIAFHKQRRGEQ